MGYLARLRIKNIASEVARRKGWSLHGRTKLYTPVGITRLPCYRCGETALFQWQICSDGNVWRPICAGCDIKLNALVLQFMNDDEWERKIKIYRESIGGE